MVVAPPALATRVPVLWSWSWRDGGGGGDFATGGGSSWDVGGHVGVYGDGDGEVVGVVGTGVVGGEEEDGGECLSAASSLRAGLNTTIPVWVNFERSVMCDVHI